MTTTTKFGRYLSPFTYNWSPLWLVKERSELQGHT